MGTVDCWRLCGDIVHRGVVVDRGSVADERVPPMDEGRWETMWTRARGAWVNTALVKASLEAASLMETVSRKGSER